MTTRMCAVCSKVAGIDKFGRGIHCPKTTCLSCKKRASEFKETKVIMMIRQTRKKVGGKE
jgi:hypothetical protein